MRAVLSALPAQSDPSSRDQAGFAACSQLRTSSHPRRVVATAPGRRLAAAPIQRHTAAVGARQTWALGGIYDPFGVGLAHGLAAFHGSQRVAFPATGAAAAAGVVGQARLPPHAGLPILVDAFSCSPGSDGLQATGPVVPGAVAASSGSFAACESQWVDRIDHRRRGGQFVQEDGGRRNPTGPRKFIDRIQKITFAAWGRLSMFGKAQRRSKAAALGNFRQKPGNSSRCVGFRRVGAPARSRIDRGASPGHQRLGCRIQRLRRPLEQSWRPCGRGFHPASRGS